MSTSRKILVIDNDKIMVKQMKSFLDSRGHQVKIAHDAFETLDIIKYFTPEIIYIDLIMPKIGGDKLCRIIRTMPQFEGCYIVIISATLAEDTLDLKDIGADSAIIKGPFGMMSKYIDETIAESRLGMAANPEIKGLGECIPRLITKELLSQNKYLQKLLESMSQGVLELENNRVLYANQSALSILRIPKEDYLCAYLNELVDLRVWERLGPRIATHRDVFSTEEADNPLYIHERHIILQCLQVDNDARKKIVLLTDVTAQKRMETIVEATNLTKNLGFIFSGIRHEIGNPVNSIKMALTVLHKNLDSYDKDTIEEFVSRSLEEVARLEYLLKALKNYSLFEKPFVQNVAIDEFMKNFLPLIKDDLEMKGIDIRTNIPKGNLVALTDSRALHHVMLNLLTNAADAVADRDNGHLTITAERRSPSIIIKVDDNGCGIPQEDRSKIFTPFFTSKPQGTGLGLAIVQRMLLSMDSTISVESISDFGTTVTIALPEGTG
jgi:signal transduction histidine kinase